ncbi:MAG: isopentenyl-diphosphate Delta-isomerase [Gemmatimonadetes bacterium]|nr:MAG: isopentenyl-diphosphate Delta-isomerase [Gemmatimonadota bacterium]
MAEHLILVDEQDRQIGTGEKHAVHIAGQLHRAFSIFVFNSAGKLLIHQRAFHKYHSGGLWTNTCCSHPRTGETLNESIHRRLMEEMGFDCTLEEYFSFIYRAEFENGLIEHELDHVFVGHYEGDPNPNPEEVAAWKWADPAMLQQDINAHPSRYTPWFKLALPGVLRRL